jgi:hypothetical protein
VAAVFYLFENCAGVIIQDFLMKTGSSRDFRIKTGGGAVSCSLKMKSAGLAPLFRRSSGRGLWARAKRAGQVTVELLLVLPVFMLLLFFIMELGNLAYQTILVHHCAYELARIGSLVAGPPGGSSSANSNTGKAENKMRSALAKMFSHTGQIQLTVTSEVTGVDPQPLNSHTNEDLLVTLIFPARLVFPGSSYFLADQPKGRRIKNITVRVRMPIEKPVFQ